VEEGIRFHSNYITPEVILISPYKFIELRSLFICDELESDWKIEVEITENTIEVDGASKKES
jgi:hypothetical protein